MLSIKFASLLLSDRCLNDEKRNFFKETGQLSGILTALYYLEHCRDESERYR